jgi:hypothetical protein
LLKFETIQLPFLLLDIELFLGVLILGFDLALFLLPFLVDLLQLVLKFLNFGILLVDLFNVILLEFIELLVNLLLLAREQLDCLC